MVRSRYLRQAMRYPLNAHSKELAAAQEAREEEKRFVSPLCRSLPDLFGNNVCSPVFLHPRQRRSKRETKTLISMAQETWTRSDEASSGEFEAEHGALVFAPSRRERRMDCAELRPSARHVECGQSRLRNVKENLTLMQ